MIGKSEEKLRPKSIVLRRVIARYVIWVEVAGYLLVIALFGGLIWASFVKADDDFLDIPCDITLRADALLAAKSAEVVSVQPEGAPVTATPDEGPVVLEESPTLVARASLIRDLRHQREFARTQKQENVAASISGMIAQAQAANNAAPERRHPVPKTRGGWHPMVAPGDIVTSGTILGVVINPRETQIDLNLKAPAVSENGGKLKPDQPATITLTAGGSPIYFLGRMVQGGRQNPRVEVTEIPPTEAAKLIAFYRQNPTHSGQFPGANTKVLVGWKSWASLIWK